MALSAARQGHLAMLAFSALVAGSFSLGALASPHIDPSALTALRFVLAAPLVGVAAWAGGGLRGTMWQAPWRYGVLAALMAAYFILMFEGLRLADAVSTAAVFTLTPVMAAGFGWLLMRQRLTLRIALALALGATGALWVIFRADLGRLMALEIGPGEAIYFWGCAAHALYTPLVRRLNRGEPAASFTFGTLAIGAVLVTLWALPALLQADWAAMPPVVWITLAYTAIAATAATFVLVQFASLRLPSSKVMAYTYLTPSWVVMWELALSHPAPSMAILPGLGLTLISLWLLLESDNPPSGRGAAPKKLGG